MATFVSKDGVWKPARERVSFFDKDGMPQIYDGPDRAAVKYLKESGEEHLGMHFSEHPENIERAHDRNMTVDKFCKTEVYTQEKRDKDFKEKEAKVNTHRLPERSAMKEKLRSGGDNTAGSGNLVGGMSDGDPLTDAIASVGKKK